MKGGSGSEPESGDEEIHTSLRSNITSQKTTVTRDPADISTTSTPVTTGGSGIIGGNITSLRHRGGQDDTVILQAVLIPTFLGLVVVVTLVLCLVYKAKVREILKHAVKPIKKRRKKETEINFKTLKEMEDGNKTYTDPSTYSVVENKVIVSSLPVSSPIQQETVPQDENYSALNRQNDSKKNAPSNNDTDYDSLNHSNQVTMHSASDNTYSSLNPAFNSTENILSNHYGIYN